MLYPEVVISGELANFRISKNAWVYLDLKDEAASVKFFGSVRSLPGPLEDGMLLEIAGRPYLHPLFGFSVQIIDIVPVGVGALNKAYILLQKKLETEGLFDPARKRPLPFAPEHVGLIASSESAGYGDFMKVIKARWPFTSVELFDVQVQGRDAPEQIIRAVEQANQRTDLKAIVIVRGGGSRDDLAAFDHEQVVRAIAASRLPTLTAIGHERDIVLSELVSDVRASTPSNAAELLVPDRRAELEWLKSKKVMLSHYFESYSGAVERLIAEFSGSLDFHLQQKLHEGREFAATGLRLLAAYDPRLPLDRGYALARTREGKALRDRASARGAGKFSLEFKDGSIEVNVRSD